MQIGQNKNPEPQWVSKLMAMESKNNQIKDLQEKWKNKYETELANLNLDNAKTLPLFVRVKSFLEKVYSSDYTNKTQHEIKDSGCPLNNSWWIEFEFDKTIRDSFLNFIECCKLSETTGFKILTESFGNKLDTTKMYEGHSSDVLFWEWKIAIGNNKHQEINDLLFSLYQIILKEAKISTQNEKNKPPKELLDEDIFKIINAYPKIFGSKNLYKEYKEKVLWPRFVNELSNDDQESIKKLNFNEFGDLEEYKPSIESFWNIYSKGSEDWLVGELDNYFKLEPEQRGDSILKKILTDKLVDIKRLTESQINKNTYTNLGEFIKKYFDKYFGDYSEYIYCTLGEFFGDNDDFFNKVCKADATRILKYYQEYLLTDLGSDFYSRLKQETELAKGDVDKNNLNDELNLKEKANPQEQEIVKINVSEQKQDLIDKNVWKKPFWILLGITVLLSIGTGVACVVFDATLLLITAPSTSLVFTVFSGYRMFTFKSKENYDNNILLPKTNEPENVYVTDLKKNVPKIKEEVQDKDSKQAKIKSTDINLN